jgi:hypothetical protein
MVMIGLLDVRSRQLRRCPKLRNHVRLSAATAGESPIGFPEPRRLPPQEPVPLQPNGP